MGDEALIRREALLGVLKARGLKEQHAQVAYLSGLKIARDTYWRDLLKGNKSFGEKMARKIESALEPPLPRGYLDNPTERGHGGPDIVTLSGDRMVVMEAKRPYTAGPIEPPKPDPKFTDTRTPPSESEWAILDALRSFPQEERDRIRTEMKQKAEYWQRIAKELLKDRAGN